MIDALLLSLRTTAVAAAALVVVGVPLAYLLARKRFPGKILVETAVGLPLVLPPTVVGYYLLVFLGRGGPMVEWLGIDLVFTWGAVAAASAVMGLPLMVNAARVGFASVDPRLEDAARTLGAGEWSIFRRVTLPLARRGVAVGLVLGSIRALGEFGASLMVAGNIPGRTRTMPLSMYDAVQRMDYAEVHTLVFVMTLLAAGGLLAARRLEADLVAARD
ncbi:MAG: molybdate ABC transporter permease subunit [Planctomycetia bacterium]